MEKEQEPINNSSNETENLNTETENHNDPISENEKKDERKNFHQKIKLKS